MSQKQGNVEVDKIADYSSGDSNKMNMKQNREENNNEIDGLTKDLEGMGCIVDAVKRPPNICMEACVHEDSITEKAAKTEEETYSDEFEEESGEEESISTEIKSIKSEMSKEIYKDLDLKLTKSQSSMSTRRPHGSNSSMSGYGSISIPHTRRINMSFTNDRLREIERHNHILLNKILSVRNSKNSSIPPQSTSLRKPVPAAAVQRKMQQRKIDHDNMILLKKIQRAKSSSYSLRR